MRLLAAAAVALVPAAWGLEPPTVAFDSFEYTGHDAVFTLPLPAASYRNPILAGFHPDPSVTRVGDRYYLVNSTFSYFPGIPVFESADLVHWRQIGNVIDRTSELNFDGLGVSRGIFAPSIRFHAGVFYVAATAVDAGGNFLSVARNPAGPWSDPIWLPQLDGIDPSLFFDDDDRAYLLNNGPPPGKARYEGHRAIWMQQIDLATRRLIGPRRVLINGGVHPRTHPVWIEGPHLYQRAGWYYLMCAEGGTSTQHSEVILRSRTVWGPFRAYRANPILTQRDLSAGRVNPIADVGHADLVVGPDERWWAVFLGVRPYQHVHFNTGRETFLLPVTWRHGWPIIEQRDTPVPYVALAPTAADGAGNDTPAETTSGNFRWRDDFNQAQLSSQWLYLRAPRQPWADLRSRPGWLTIHALPLSLDTLGNPTFLGRRQQHTSFEASTALELPLEERVAADIALFEDEHHWYFFGARRHGDAVQIFLDKDAGGGSRVVGQITASGAPDAVAGRSIRLKVSGQAQDYSFYYDVDGGPWRALVEADDGSILSTDLSGGFVGTMLGPYARSEAAR